MPRLQQQKQENILFLILRLSVRRFLKVAASSVTPAPHPVARQSADATPIPLSTEEPAPTSDVKVESPPIPAESGEVMDIEPADSTSVVPEPTQEEPKVVDEDVEMPDA